MKWLRRKLYRWLNGEVAVCSGSVRTIGAGGGAFTLELYSVDSGGLVVQTRTYNKKTDDSVYGLYYVSSEMTLGDELAKIITKESLKA